MGPREHVVNREASGPLRSRTALITGGGSGLGSSIARHVSAAGARVIVVGRNRANLERVVGELGRDVRGEPCDTSDERSVGRLASALADESIDILINNAGIAGPVAPLVEVGLSEWDEVFAVNVRGVFLMCRAFLPPMLESGRGDIINLASVTGKRPLARRTPYAASKMAVLGLTTTLAHEVGPNGISVNSLSPGPVSGPRMQRNFRLEADRLGISDSEAERAFTSRAAYERMVTDDEVGHAVVAMLGMGGLTGADIDLSAGMIGR